LTTSAVTTVAGTQGTSGLTDGVGTNAGFRFPTGVAVDASGTTAIIADSNNHMMRLVTLSSGAVSTLAGTPGVAGSTNGVGSAAAFSLPRGVAWNAANTVALIVSIGQLGGVNL
jgi:hypothetical protein